MLSEDDWQECIKNAPANTIVHAHSDRGKRFSSCSMPFLLGCNDGYDYVVKPGTYDTILRTLCSDQIMGHIASTIGAPTPIVRLVEISDEFLKMVPAMSTISAGIAHGSRYMKNVSNVKLGVQHQDLPENRVRFALLAIMYGLAGVFEDHQFFYEDTSNRVWSFDHGHFFNGGPSWTADSIRASPAPEPDPLILRECNFDESELKEAAQCLHKLVNGAIAFAVASPVDAWKIVMEERLAIAQHFRSRADALVE